MNCRHLHVEVSTLKQLQTGPTAESAAVSPNPARDFEGEM